jgi:hypothetical protein
MTNLPTWVLKRDGRREPFESDKISQALFAATETLGAANAFLARELADGVLHFLAQESAEDVVSAGGLAELVEKVVRELGQPALAQAFARGVSEPRPAPERGAEPARPSFSLTLPLDAQPDQVPRAALAAYSLQVVFGRDLAAAHEEGLIALGELETPAQLASVALDGPLPSRQAAWEAAWLQVESTPARLLVIDSAELFLRSSGAEWLPAFDRALGLTGKCAVLNLNIASPPRWAQEGGAGPLFSSSSAASTAPSSEEAWRLVQELRSPRLRVDWHLHEHDFHDESRRRLVSELCAQATSPLALVLDRPRQLVHLAEGVDRQCPAVLLEVGLNLPGFLERPEVSHDVQRLLDKLPSLARMAVRAGVQKRRYLRRQAAALSRGFLLDRARLVVTLRGLCAAARTLLQESPARSPRSLELARKIVHLLVEQLGAESRAANLDIVVDSPAEIVPGGEGLSCVDAAAAPPAQLHAAGALHRAAGRGTAVIYLSQATSADERRDLLHNAWQRGEAVRLRWAGERG